MAAPTSPRKAKIQALKSRFKSHPKHTDDASPTFHPFPRLPVELQLHVLEYCTDRTPRIFELGGDIVHDDIPLKNTMLTLYLPSCPAIRVPLPAVITSALRGEMAKKYERVEFANGIVWINFNIDTIFISCLTDFRLSMNFFALAEYNTWIHRIENLAISIDKFLEFESLEKGRTLDQWRDNLRIHGLCNPFMCYISERYSFRSQRRMGKCDDLRDATSFLDFLSSVPKVQELGIVHQCIRFRCYNTGILPGPLEFHPRRSLAKEIKETVGLEGIVSRRIRLLSLLDARFEEFGLDFVELDRNGVHEENLPDLIYPYSNQCRNRVHKIKNKPCACRWAPILPPGFTKHKADEKGPYLTDAHGKRVPFHFDESVRRWKLGDEVDELKVIWGWHHFHPYYYPGAIRRFLTWIGDYLDGY